MDQHSHETIFPQIYHNDSKSFTIVWGKIDSWRCISMKVFFPKTQFLLNLCTYPMVSHAPISFYNPHQNIGALFRVRGIPPPYCNLRMQVIQWDRKNFLPIYLILILPQIYHNDSKSFTIVWGRMRIRYIGRKLFLSQ